MAKKKENANSGELLVPIVVILAIMVGVLFYTGNLDTAKEYILSSTSVNESSTAPDDTIAPIGPTNLRQLFLPMLTHYNTSEMSCNTYDGDWFENGDAVGCWDTATTINTTMCSTLQYILAQNACYATGAIAYCDAHNIGCRYE